MMNLVTFRTGDFTRISAQKLVMKGYLVVQSLQNHPEHFDSPPYSPEILAQAVNVLAAKNVRASSNEGSNRLRNEKENQKQVVLRMLLHTGVYVCNVANMREKYEEKKAVLELASYSVSNGSRHPIEPVKVTGLKITVSAIIGQQTIKARWRKGKCRNFLVEATQGDTLSGNTKWKTILVSPKAKCAFTLQPGKWSVRIVGVYARGNAQPSDNISFVIS